MYKYKAVLFDLDGTLLNTSFDLAESLNYALDKNGYPTYSTDKVVQMVGHGIPNLIKTATNAPEEVLLKIRGDFREFYRQHLTDKTLPYDGIVDLLTDLRKNGIKMAVVSNKYDLASKVLIETFFNGLIDYVVGEHGCPVKPDPYMCELALKNLGVDKNDCVFVGDSDTDINTALNTKIDCISVTWGFRSREFLISHGAKNLVDSVLELQFKL